MQKKHLWCKNWLGGRFSPKMFTSWGFYTRKSRKLTNFEPENDGFSNSIFRWTILILRGVTVISLVILDFPNDFWRDPAIPKRLPPLKLTARPWKWILTFWGPSFPIFRGFHSLLALGRDFSPKQKSPICGGNWYTQLGLKPSAKAFILVYLRLFSYKPRAALCLKPLKTSPRLRGIM